MDDNLLKVREDLQAEYKNNINDYNEAVEQLKQNITDESAEHIQNLRDQLEQARILLGIMSDVAITGNYQKMAVSNEKSADNLRIISIGIMAVLSIILILTIWNIGDGSFDWIRL